MAVLELWPAQPVLTYALLMILRPVGGSCSTPPTCLELYLLTLSGLLAL